jgi:pyruvate/2-oxoglutarate dehydrogenase complex dihydrolipoamide acyltransferase (E2) component
MTLSVPRLLLSFLIAIAILPAVAKADSGLPQVPVPASDALTTTAHALAVAHWGVDPCAGQVTVTWAHMGAGINARSTWMSYDVHNPATYTQCAISYNLDVDWDWPKLCTVIEHELGHLSGHDHVNDPHDVMSPYYVYPTPECAAGAVAPAAAPAPATTAQSPATPPAASKAVTKKKAKATVAKAKAKVKVAKRKAATRGARAKGSSARSTRTKKAAAKKSSARKASARKASAKKASAKKASAKKGSTRGAVRAASADSSDLPLLFSPALGSF